MIIVLALSTLVTAPLGAALFWAWLGPAGLLLVPVLCSAVALVLALLLRPARPRKPTILPVGACRDPS